MSVLEPGGAVAALNAIRAAAAAAAMALKAIAPVDLAGADTVAPQSAADALAIDLKTRLAVRGWVNPRLLIDMDADPDIAMQALNAVACDVETLFEMRPGEWFLTVPSRRRVLARRGRDVIREELAVERWRGDAGDPTRLAFRQELGLDPVPLLAKMSEPLLRALGGVRDWLAPEGAEPLGRAEILAEIAARERQDDIVRMTAVPLIGASHREALATLVADLTRPPQAPRELAARYVHGAGGSGKSTVLAHLQLMLAEHACRPIVARLDFDDRLVNPLDPASLELAFFAQLGVALPEVANRFETTLAALRDVRRRQRDEQADASRNYLAHRVAMRAPDPRKRAAVGASLMSEGASERERAERDSLLHGILGNEPALAQCPIVLLLDTAEVVIAAGPAAVLEVAKWLGSIGSSLQAPCLRVVVAGRDPPSPTAALDLVGTIATLGHEVLPPIALAELAPDEAVQLLRNAGVLDEEVARAAAEALPGNPLLLRMAADALATEPELAEEVHRAHAEGQIDPVSARRYLARRIVAHLADSRARPYVLAALLLPEVTPTLLREVVIPVVDGRAPPKSTYAAKVFASLSASRWLTHAADGRRALSFHPDIRSLALRLIEADRSAHTLIRRIRERAIEFHEKRRNAADRAFALYHRMAAGEVPEQIVHREAVARRLAPVIRDLPEAARDALLGAGRAMPTKRRATDDEWRAMLEGHGKDEGQGARMLKRGNAAAALALYRSRPTRPPGAAPTFVMQALADSGAWDGDEVQTDRMLDAMDLKSEAARLSAERSLGLYWLTRLELMRRAGPLGDRHESCLQRACATRTPHLQDAMPEIVAVAEAFAGRRIAPDRWLSSGTGEASRLKLVRGLHFGMAPEHLPRLDQVVVTQCDWIDRLRQAGGSGMEGADHLQTALCALDGKPFAAVAATLRDLPRQEACSWEPESRDLGVVLLRGLTTEFARPLRETMTRRYRALGGAAALVPVTAAVAERMTIRPQEFAPDILPERLAADAEAWFGALVGYADRCRLLPLLCERLIKVDDPAITRVARAFLAWDKAICAGGSSAW